MEVKMNTQTQEAFGSDAQLEKHAKEHYGFTLNQFKLMCEEAHKRYEGQFSNSVDKALAVESFYEGFKVAIKEALEQPTVAELNDEYLRDTNVIGLEQPAQEPVAWMAKMGSFTAIAETKKQLPKGTESIALYTHPHQCKKLTNDRIREIGDNCLENNNGLFNWIDFARAIEQALKEKNT
jgi:hypothetical protein